MLIVMVFCCLISILLSSFLTEFVLSKMLLQAQLNVSASMLSFPQRCAIVKLYILIAKTHRAMRPFGELDVSIALTAS